MIKTSPKFSFKLLRWFCPDYLYEELSGDLMQRYERDVKMFGERRAGRKLFWNTIRFFRPGILMRNKVSVSINQSEMLGNHLKLAIRIFFKDKLFSTLNILGLALGIGVSIIFLLILQSDLTFDQHYVHHDRIYRLGAHYQIPGTDINTGKTARELGPILKDQYPEIQAMTRVEIIGRSLVKYDKGNEEVMLYEDGVAQTDSSYFNVFSHRLIAGDKASCLSDPGTMLVTASVAKKYFGDNDPLNKILWINNKPRRVTGLMSDFPDNTHLKFDFLLSGLPDLREDWDGTMKDGKPIPLVFWNPDVYTYLLMPERYDVDAFYSRFGFIYDRYFKVPELDGKSTAILQPLTSIHFSDFEDDVPYGNMTYVITFSGIGVMIVLLACINYMNLSTAKAVSRATEIAVKKISGSQRSALFMSFLVESVFLSFISLFLAMVAVFVVLDLTSFNQLIGKNLSLDVSNSTLLIGAPAIALVIGIFSGIYPAFYLPSIPSISALKGTFKNRQSSQVLRKVLITVQFSISIFVVVCTLFMQNQIDYVRNKDLGFRRDDVLVIPIGDTVVRDRVPLIKADLMQHKDVVSITASQALPGMNIGGNVMFGETPNGMEKRGGIMGLFVGDDYLSTMGITLLKGRDFAPGRGIDEDGIYIANETAVKLMGWGDDPLGKRVAFWGNMNPGKVVGVVKDFNSYSLHRPMDPMFIVKGHWQSGFLLIRLKTDHLPETIEYVKSKWAGYDPNRPFEYFFLDQKFNEQYKEDEIQNRLLSSLSGICIFISLLGLVGLAAFSAAQRTKEMGVRKVLGANVKDIIVLLSGNVLRLAVVSSLLVIPLSYWVIVRWLENFAYRMELDYSLYLVVTLATMGFVFITILLQSLKTARANPVDSLKYE